MNNSGNSFWQSNTGVNRDSTRRGTEPTSSFVPKSLIGQSQPRETKPGTLHDQSSTQVQDLTAIFANMMMSGLLTPSQLKQLQRVMASSTPVEMTANRPSMHVSFEGLANPGDDAPQDDVTSSH